MAKKGRVIAVVGFTGSGKDYTAARIAEERKGFTHIDLTFKTFAEREGFKDVLEFQKVVSNAKNGIFNDESHRKFANFDFVFDAELIKTVQFELDNGNNVVLSTWLGPWLDIVSEKLVELGMLDKALSIDFKVFLEAPLEMRAERIMDGRTDAKGTLDDNIKYVQQKDQNNFGRYIAVYDIDIQDPSGFDLIIDTAEYDDTKQKFVNLDVIADILEAFDGKCNSSDEN